MEKYNADLQKASLALLAEEDKLAGYESALATATDALAAATEN